MAVTFLLDTSALSEPIKPTPNRRFLQRWNQHSSRCAIASVSWYELWYGCLRLPASRRRDTLERYLSSAVQPLFPILEYNADAAVIHAELRVGLERQGVTLPVADLQIASIAITHRLTVVTMDESHFSRIPSLRVQNWLS